MKITEQQFFAGERALFGAKDTEIRHCTFADGESPLKHSQDLRLVSDLFKWKYPLWYSRRISVEGCTFFDGARAGIWYTDEISMCDTVVEAPKNFRRCRGVTLRNVDFPNAAETLWNCRDITGSDVRAKGDYFAMNCENVVFDRLTLVGNYSFDGAKNVEIRDSRLLSKDAFWNSDGVTVRNSFLSGEYLGWNAKNLTLIDCTIESLQGMCYIENLVMKNCRLLNTTLAFEYSTVDARLTGHTDSILNPAGGKIVADDIGEILIDADRVDPSKTEIVSLHGEGSHEG